MATIPFTEVSGQRNDLITFRWEDMSEADDGAILEMVPNKPDKTVQVLGNFGAGGAVTIEGSLDGVVFVPLNDPQGNPLVITIASILAVLENVRYIRPNITAGTGVSLDVLIQGSES